jgi:hypothetical protein
VHLLYFVAIWYICGHLVYLWPFGIFVAIWYICGHLVYLWPFGIFVVIWYIFSCFGKLVEEKSGNPARQQLPKLVRS